ncbi:MAG: PDZ domain-containing protein [Phycisphaerales bacterium]
MTMLLNTTRGGNGRPARVPGRVAAFRSLAGLAAGVAALAVGLPVVAGVGELGGVLKSRRPATVAIVDRAQPPASSESSYVFSSNENGRTLRIEMKNGVVTHAEIDGKVVADDRIERDGDVIRLKGDAGQTLYEHRVTTAELPPVSGFPGLTMTPRARAFTLPGSDIDALALREPAPPPPPVMVGIQMAVPDATLRGHLGLKDGASTMLSAVHEGLPAGKAGLGPYDIIVSINGKDDASPEAIRAALKDMKPGDTLRLGVIQKGVRKDVTVTVEAYDRKRLDEAKVDAIAGGATWNSLDPMAWSATIDRNMINALSGAGLDDEQMRDILLRIGAGQSGPFMQVFPDGGRGGARALIDAERAAAQARERLMLDRNAQLEQMRRQMTELQKMMERMMNEKLPPPNPQEVTAPPPREGRS